MQYKYNKKIVCIEELLNIINTLDRQKIVFTNGCFDILHRGHIKYLRESRSMGDILVVGLNSDESVRRLKGDNRPYNNENDRAYILEALDFVDYIVIFNEDTPLNLINMIKPNIYTKGGDYDLNDIIGPNLGSSIIEAYGGQVKLIGFQEGYSTTKLLNSKFQKK